jgi:hypothetical protein
MAMSSKEVMGRAIEFKGPDRLPLLGGIDHLFECKVERPFPEDRRIAWLV